MHPAARVRTMLARHPAWYWAAVAVLAVTIAVLFRDHVAEVERARDRWGSARPAIVADGDHGPGDALRASTVLLPVAAVPPSALEALPAGARVRQRVAAGEIVVATDIGRADGPAARADPGTAVVGIVDPAARPDEIGVAVRVVADGVVLADRGAIVEVRGETVYVAVDADRGAAVAAAAQQRRAAIVYLP